MLIHSKEKLLNFLLLTQQWPDKLNRLLNPSIKKKKIMARSDSPGADSHDSIFPYLFQCMICIGGQHRVQVCTTIRTFPGCNRQLPWGTPGGAKCWRWFRRPGFCSRYCLVVYSSSSLFLGSVQQSIMCLTSLDFNNNLSTKPVLQCFSE